MLYLGGTHATPQAMRTIRYAGLAVPVVLVLYGVLQSLGVFEGIKIENEGLLYGVASVWLLVALWQFIAPAKHKTTAAIRLALFHVLAAAYFMWGIGTTTPLIALWTILLLAAYLYFGRLGASLSAAILAGMLIVTAITDMTSAAWLIVSAVTVLTVSSVILSIHRAQTVDRKELQRSHEQEILQRDRILTIVNNLADAILSTDKSGVVRVYNAASLSLLDTNDSLNGHHIDTILPLVDQGGQPLIPSELLAQAASVTVRDDVWYQFEDGERIRLEMAISPIRKTFRHSSAGQDGYIIIMRDVTKAKSLEEERDEFISVVSHELRTPITVAEGSLSNLELMLDKADIGKDRIKQAVRTSHEQTLYLAKMVNDLSALSRAERGASDECEVINVKELIKSLYEKYAPKAKAKKLTLDLDVGGRIGSIEASRLYVEEVLQNLVTNAIKYTKTGGVTVSAQQKGDIITFAVKDTGIGISKSDHTKVFGKFYRSEDYRTRETGGTGLGLYVVTKLARKLGTEIQLTSRLNYGSTFSFELPVHVPASSKKQKK